MLLVKTPCLSKKSKTGLSGNFSKVLLKKTARKILAFNYQEPCLLLFY